MSIFLSAVIQAPEVDSGTGNVTVAPTESGGDLNLNDSTGTPQIVISDSTTTIGSGVVSVSDSTNELTVNSTQPVNSVVTTFTHATADPDNKLATVGAITSFFDSQVSGVLGYADFETKAAFDAFLLTDPMDATIVLVTDSVAFDYTDTKGGANAGVTWWLGICEHFAGEDLVTSTLFTSNSQGALTGPEIKAALFAESDCNNYDDSAKAIVDAVTSNLSGKVDVVAGKDLSTNDYSNAAKSKVDNAPNDTNTALAAKADVSGQVFAGVVQANTFGTTSTNADQAIAIGNGGANDTGNSGLAWRVGTSTTARSGNYRAQMRMNYDNDKWEFRTGNSSNVNSMGVALSIDSGQQVLVNGSPVLTELTGLTTAADSEIINASLSISNPGSGNGYLEFNNSTASADQRAYRLYATSAESLRIETVDGSGTSVNRYTFGHNGDLELPGNIEVAGYISMFDAGGHEHRLERGGDGIALRALLNPADGESIFSIQSSGNSMRLNVPHIGDITTSNNGIRVGTDSNGSNGRVVLEEGNWALIQSAIGYSGTPFPALTATDMVDWSGREVTFTGVGAVSLTMPAIVTGTPTGSQIKAGETMTLHNFNSGSSITVNAASGQKMVNGDSGNVSGTGGSITILAGNSVRMIASDESGVAAVDAICWLVRPFG
ncbi:hypothetical protein NVP1029O_15 [Vibrio phage 1.029.O._10N.261.55.A7]|nr:hypothetical protein NVP1029O_15 [Vibrio phage 1.029.O._10N.261.55.A7]